VIRVEVVLAWPDRYQQRQLELAEGCTVADAVAAAVHGVLAPPQQLLREGDRIELLRPLLADPKENRRRRARGGD